MGLLTVSGSPHVHGDDNVKKIMYNVILAMVPAMLVSFYYFGMGAVQVTLVAVASCILFEYLIQKFLIKGSTTINDGSAIITGVLLAFNLPSNLPIWMVIIGALVAIGIGKMSFGGLGKNPFNPALVGRVFLLISFPVHMTSWPVIKPLFSFNIFGKCVGCTEFGDAVTGATILGHLKSEEKLLIKAGEVIETAGVQGQMTVDSLLAQGLPLYNESGQEVARQIVDYKELIIGQMSGSLGEISALALLIGALFLFYRKILTWHIPVSYLVSSMLFASIFWLIDPGYYVNPLYHLFAGGLMLGIFFMATDMVTSPMSVKGQLIFGVGCGVLTMVIRFFGSFPEGVSFAILIMNAFVPLINRGFKPTRFGEVIKQK